VCRQIGQFWSKYIASINRVLNGLFVISVSIIVLRYINVAVLHIPELFPGGSEVWEVLYQLSLALISAYIFYFIVTHWKRQQDKGNLLPFLSSKTTAIIDAAKAVAGHLAETSGHKFDTYLPSKDDTEAMCAKVKAGEQFSWWPKYGIMVQTHLEYLVFHMRHTKQNIASIYTRMPYLDSEYVKLLANIDDSHYFSTLEQLEGANLGNSHLSFLASELQEYFERVQALRVYQQHGKLER
jgi:hypothetical protein